MQAFVEWSAVHVWVPALDSEPAGVAHQLYVLQCVCKAWRVAARWSYLRRQTRTEAAAAAEAEGAGDEGTCWLCQGSIEGVVGALGCAGTTGCAGRFCAACLPEIQAGIAAGELRSCPSCRSAEPPTGPGGAGASLRLCRDFDASRTHNAFESIALPLLSPPRDGGAGEARRLQGEDDATMAARLQEEEQAAWLQQRREARRRELEESDARDARKMAQLQEQLRAQRPRAAAQRDARGAEGSSSTAAARLQRGVESARTGGAAGGGASSATPGSAAIGGDDMGDDALDSHALPEAGSLNPSPIHAASSLHLSHSLLTFHL